MRAPALRIDNLVRGEDFQIPDVRDKASGERRNERVARLLSTALSYAVEQVG